jgi:hypothetical protein
MRVGERLRHELRLWPGSSHRSVQLLIAFAQLRIGQAIAPVHAPLGARSA